MEEFKPDLILLDIMMPGMNGYEVCKKIRSNSKLAFVKIIMVSGKAMIEERLTGYESGADDYMTKPFTPEEMLAKAHVFLKLNRTEHSLLELNQTLDQKVQERTKQLLNAEAKLICSAKYSALGEMAGGIAHEINTPLTTINLTLDLIKDTIKSDSLDPTKMVHDCKTIEEMVERISIIINGLKIFAREANSDSKISISIDNIVKNTLNLCCAKIKNNGIQLSINGPKNPDLKIQGCSVQISQIILNLINNAFDALQESSDKWIRLDVEEDHDFIKISVTDSGKGVPENLRDKIFQPFFTTKEIGKGTGLGLSISKGIAEAHYGTLTLDAEYNKGSRFILKIPQYK